MSSRVNTAEGTTQPAEAFGDEARRFVEDRLLQRNVEVEILDLSPQGHLIAHILHPKGNISKFILEAGLARCTDHHSVAIGAQMADFRQAEKRAQAAKLALWKNHAGPKPSQGGDSEVTVVRVFSADVVYVRNKAGAEKRVNLSSVRGPRAAEASESPYRDEAKEFTRKKLIGKHVRMTIDGTTPATGEYEAKEMVTIKVNDKNIALQLVQEGYATVIRHRRDDTDRSPIYDELLAVQETAKEEKKGIHSGKAPKTKPFTDASESVRTAKLQLAALQRQKRIPAVVDFVKSSSRFVILIPREHVRLTLVLSGIRAPKSARNANEASEPCGQEGHDLANKRLGQRDVEVNIQNIDKVGGFIGELFIGKESFSKILVEEGFATVHGYSAEQAGNANELNAAEKRAKDARKGLWVNYDPDAETTHEQVEASTTNGKEQASGPRPKDYRNVVITHIEPDGRVKLQVLGSGTTALESMMSGFATFHLNPANSAGLPGPPKQGDYVSAKFSEDGQWYRARIRANDREAKKAEIVYVDYGNSEKQPWAKLRPLPSSQFGTEKLRPQAAEAALSLVQLPGAADYLADALRFLEQATAGRELVANVDDTDKGTGVLSVTLYDRERCANESESLNAELVEHGHAMVARKLKGWERSVAKEVWENLRQQESAAKAERRGMWEYGDITED